MNRFYIKFILIFLMYCNLMNGQPFILQVKIEDQPENYVVIGALRGDKFSPLDTLPVYTVIDSSDVGLKSENNIHKMSESQTAKSVNFHFPENAITGMYRLIFGKTTYAKVMGEPPQQLDFIFNNEDVVFETDFKAPQDSLKVINSDENFLWFQFLQEEKKIKERLDELEKELNYYQDKVKATPDAHSGIDLSNIKAKAHEKANEFNQLQIQRDMYISKMVNENEGSFAARLIQIFREPFRDGYLNQEERKRSYQQEYFRYLDFFDESLINSQILTEKIFNYLITYNQPGYTKEQREKAYIEAVDIVLSKVRDSDYLISSETIINDMVYKFILNYLIDGFEMLKMYNVIEYISENYKGSFCQTDDKSTLERKIDYLNMKAGTIVPDFILNDINGDPVTLSYILKGRNLILFWASWCPHCCEMLQMIRTWYDQAHGNNLEIIAISIDTSLTEWYKALVKAGFEVFYNLSDLQGWDGSVTKGYNIYATPTMFIIDQNRKILAKPVSFQELIETIRK